MNLSPSFRDTITIQSVSGVTGNYGDPAYAATRTILVKQQSNSTFIENSDGNMVRAEHLMLTDQPISITDLIWPSGADPAQANQGRTVLKVTSDTVPSGQYRLYRAYV